MTTPIYHIVSGRAVATCKCKQCTLLSGLLWLIEVKVEHGEIRTTNVAVRSCPRCNQFLDAKGMGMVQ